MKKANNSEFLLRPRSSMYGLNLGSVCNHVKLNNYKSEFKMDFSKPGLISNKIKHVPSELKINIKDKVQWLALIPIMPLKDVNLWLNKYKENLDNNLTCFYNESNFLIFVKNNPEYKEYLLYIYKAFMEKDISLGYPFFDNNFNFIILNRVPQKLVTLMIKRDEKKQQIYDIVKANQIEYKLIQAGLKYSNFIPEFNKNETKIKYFIKPENTSKYNTGWFSLKDLKDWIEGKGVIIK